MAKIILKEPNGPGPHTCVIDTGVMDVEILESYLGVGFVSESGEKLSVCVRDTGFEVRHTDVNGVSTKWLELKGTNEAINK